MLRIRIRKNRSAFTLIELMLVMVILVALAGIVVVSFSGVDKKEERDQGKGRYFEPRHRLLELIPKATSAIIPTRSTRWCRTAGQCARLGGSYVKPGLPVDPWGHPYIYACPGAHQANGFDLSSAGDGGRAAISPGWITGPPPRRYRSTKSLSSSSSRTMRTQPSGKTRDQDMRSRRRCYNIVCQSRPSEAPPGVGDWADAPPRPNRVVDAPTWPRRAFTLHGTDPRPRAYPGRFAPS